MRQSDFHFATRRGTGSIIAVLLWLVLATPGTASSESTIEFEVCQSQDSLCAWINLSDLLTANRVAHLKEGIPVSIECRCVLVRPRRLWGHEKLAEASWKTRLVHRSVTNDYFLETTDGREVVFSSLARLHRYLSDSVTVQMLPMVLLDSATSYRLQVNLSLLWLTALNVSPTADGTNSPGSMLRYLFGNFLEFSGYGREELELESGSFSPPDLPERGE